MNDDYRDHAASGENFDTLNRKRIGRQFRPSQDQKDVLAVSFLKQQFVAKMQGTGAEEAREGREGYLLSRLCQ